VTARRSGAARSLPCPRSGLLGWLGKLGSKAGGGISLDCRRKPGSPRAVPAWFQVSRGSVDEVLYNITDKLIIGTANGSEVVEVAFQHLTFVSGPGGVCDTASERGLEQRISESLSSTLKGYFDPTIGIRVDCMVNPSLPSNQVNMYLGQGIFVPRRGERPIGWIRYYPDPFQPTMYMSSPLARWPSRGCLQGTGRAGDWHRRRNLHADIDLGFGEEVQSSFLFINKDSALAPSGAKPVRAASMQACPSAAATATNRCRAGRRAGDDQCDIAWKIDFVATAQVPGRLEICRRSAPLAAALETVERCNAAISSLLFDLRDLSQRDVDRVWIDLDHDNILTAYALQVPRISLVWDCENEEQYVYEWGQTGAPFKTPGSVGLKCRTIDNNIIEFGRADGEPFGYLELPEVPDKVIFSDTFQSFSGYHLDWLDQCGRVSFGDTVLSLGEAYAEKCSGMPVSGFEPGQTRKVVGPLVLTPYEGG
jgi:hypothetical protein